MAQWAAVYDASGTQSNKNQQPLGVAGLVSSAYRWTRLEAEWAAVLNDSQFTVPYLHMNEFNASRGPFKSGWEDNAKRAQFLQRLCRVIKNNVNKVFMIYVPLRVFDAVNKQYKLDEGIGGAYSFAAVMTMELVDLWMLRKHPREPLFHIVEKGDAGQGQFRRFCEENKLKPHVVEKYDPKTNKWFRPFEAADLVAYEFVTEFARAAEPIRAHGPRGAFLELLFNVPREVRTATVPALTEICKRSPDLFQPRA
jgi:hypothetical protein